MKTTVERAREAAEILAAEGDFESAGQMLRVKACLESGSPTRAMSFARNARHDAYTEIGRAVCADIIGLIR